PVASQLLSVLGGEQPVLGRDRDLLVRDRVVVEAAGGDAAQVAVLKAEERYRLALAARAADLGDGAVQPEEEVVEVADVGIVAALEEARPRAVAAPAIQLLLQAPVDGGVPEAASDLDHSAGVLRAEPDVRGHVGAGDAGRLAPDVTA